MLSKEVQQCALFHRYRTHTCCRGRGKIGKRFMPQFFFCNESNIRLCEVIFRYYKLSLDLKAARYDNSLRSKTENKSLVVPSVT